MLWRLSIFSDWSKMTNICFQTLKIQVLKFKDRWQFVWGPRLYFSASNNTLWLILLTFVYDISQSAKMHCACVNVLISPFLSNRKRNTDSLVWELLHGIYRLSVHRLRPSLCLQTGWILTIRYGSSDLMYKPCKPLKIVVQTERGNRTSWLRHAQLVFTWSMTSEINREPAGLDNDTHAELSTFNV
jgi:hypothetical protein